MRIVYLSNAMLPSRRANSIHVMRMCAALTAAGHDVRLIGWGGAAPEEEVFDFYGVERDFSLQRFRKWPIPGSVLVLAGQIARAAWREAAPDVYFARNPYALGMVAGRDAPLVYEAHMPPARRHQAAVERWLFGRRNFALLVVISEALRAEYRRLFPKLSTTRIVVAPDAADVRVEGRNPPGGGAPIGGRPGALQLGYAGHLYPGKGVEVLVPLAARLPEADVHLIGGHPEDVLRVRGEHGLENLHLHGFVPPHRVGGMLGRFDILLAPYQRRVSTSHPSSEIGRWMSPLKIFEYMAARRPIVASDLPVLREVLVDGQNCLLCSPTAVEEWVAAVRRLAADPVLARRLADSAHAELVERYTWAGRVGRIMGALTGALET